MLKFEHNMVAVRGLTLIKFVAPGNVTAILEAENWQKWTDLNRHISVSIDIDEKRFVVFEHIINHLFSGYGSLPQLGYYFSIFFSSKATSTFKPLNIQISNFEQVWISGSTRSHLNSLMQCSFHLKAM